MKDITQLISDARSNHRITKIVAAMDDLFNVQSPGLTMSRTYRAIVAKHAALRAIMACEDCGRQTAEKLLGVWTNPGELPKSMDRAHDFAGMVTIPVVWSAVQTATGATQSEIMAGFRDPRATAGRFLSRVLFSHLLAMSGPEVAFETGHKAGYDGGVSDSVRQSLLDVLNDQGEALRPAEKEQV